MDRPPAVDAIVGHARRVGWSTVETVHAVARAIRVRGEVSAPEAFEPEPAEGPVVELPDALIAPDELVPELLGEVYERLLHPVARRASGAHFTPRDVARALVAFALDGLDIDDSATFCDPTCGGGAFLLAMAAWLHERGWPRDEAARAVHGADIDPLAVWVSATALELWAPGCDAGARVRCIDAFETSAFRGAAFAAVVGNPPFQNQLQTATARSLEARERAVARLLGARAAYVDTAALFLVRGLELVRPGGRVALLQPHSTLAARDAAPVRAAVAAIGVLTALWFAPEPVFTASVKVCAPVIDRRPGATARVRRAAGRSFTPVGDYAGPVDAASWAPLVVDLLGVPRVRLHTTARLGDVATATAGFRDEYYGLVGAVHELVEPDPTVAVGAANPATVERDATPTERTGRQPARLVTCGLIDPLGCGWGARPATFARRRFAAPVIDLTALGGRVAAWARAQLVPKVLVATQSKVIEVWVDVDGRFVPLTPLIAVHAPPDRLWHLAAALSAPCVSAHAFTRVAGLALGAHAIKLAARQVLDLPLPADQVGWARGARLAEAAQRADPAERPSLLDELGATMDAAYGCADPEVLAWWRSRRPS